MAASALVEQSTYSPSHFQPAKNYILTTENALRFFPAFAQPDRPLLLRQDSHSCHKQRHIEQKAKRLESRFN